MNTQDENIQKHTNLPVPSKYYDIFAYRLMGLTSEQIAEKTGYTAPWIRTLFSKNGVLYDLWRHWLKTAKENSVDDAVTMMFGHLPDITRMRIMEAKSLGANAIASTKIIYKNTLDKFVKIEEEENQEEAELSEERKAEILKAFSNFNIPDDKSNFHNTDSRRTDTEQATTPPGG